MIQNELVLGSATNAKIIKRVMMVNIKFSTVFPYP